ncbi:type 1 glutamine amidotransferase domain-containing protein [Acidithiobacillus sp.]|uniref:type 1 glutamine amidotransferase domain-containing protein n=1 Tax=Acidithiobacillus sp. TaxID=1872118 RepID=UPI002623360F|nr:type 1 glutamine amidotransferase domain-containing protein [Acidithiobacillus sp.]MDD5279955.1 type 1 glutamine amidotransferase domain-containing protein [Acidithiobacillus sp.]
MCYTFLMNQQPYILFLLSSARVLQLRDGTGIPTGFWAEELVVPWNLLKNSGWTLSIGTLDGSIPIVDPESLDPANLNHDLQKASELAKQITCIPELEHPVSLQSLQAGQLDLMQGVFIPGGNGPLMDLAKSVDVARLLQHCRDHHKVLATLCHGSAALLATAHDHSDPPFSGNPVTCFSAAEEAATALAGRWPYTLEEHLRNAGFLVSVGESWQSHVVDDAQILSGQNPASAATLTEAFIQRLFFQTNKEKQQ